MLCVRLVWTLRKSGHIKKSGTPSSEMLQDKNPIQEEIYYSYINGCYNDKQIKKIKKKKEELENIFCIFLSENFIFPIGGDCTSAVVEGISTSCIQTYYVSSLCKNLMYQRHVSSTLCINFLCMFFINIPIFFEFPFGYKYVYIYTICRYVRIIRIVYIRVYHIMYAYCQRLSLFYILVLFI